MEDADANGEDGVDSGSGEGSGDVGKNLIVAPNSHTCYYSTCYGIWNVIFLVLFRRKDDKRRASKPIWREEMQAPAVGALCRFKTWLLP